MGNIVRTFVAEERSHCLALTAGDKGQSMSYGQVLAEVGSRRSVTFWIRLKTKSIASRLIFKR